MIDFGVIHMYTKINYKHLRKSKYTLKWNQGAVQYGENRFNWLENIRSE